MVDEGGPSGVTSTGGNPPPNHPNPHIPPNFQNSQDSNARNQFANVVPPMRPSYSSIGISNQGLLNLIPLYSGDSSESTTFQDFETAVRQTCHLGQWSEQQIVGIIKLKLRGAAAKFAQFEPALTRPDVEVTCETFLKALKDRFDSQLHHGSALQQLILGIEQYDTESVSSYASRVRELTTKAIPPNTDPQPFEQIGKFVFLRHLKTSIRAMTLASKPETLDAAVTAALAAERDNKTYLLCPNPTDTSELAKNIAAINLQDQSTSHSQSDRLFCNYCKVSGHLIQDCRKRSRNTSRQNNYRPSYSDSHHDRYHSPRRPSSRPSEYRSNRSSDYRSDRHFDRSPSPWRNHYRDNYRSHSPRNYYRDSSAQRYHPYRNQRSPSPGPRPSRSPHRPYSPPFFYTTLSLQYQIAISRKTIAWLSP